MIVRSEVPPLETGDHLTRAEFERRYDAMPHLKKAELIEGVVYMPSPVHWNQHAEPHADLIGWLGVYKSRTPGVRVGDNGSVRLDDENMPQPDAALIIAPDRGGQATLSDDYIDGAPDLVVEVAASSASIDLHKKFEVYQRNRVREYVVYCVHEEQLRWFVWHAGSFAPLPAGSDGIHRSEAFPGLWLEGSALARGDTARMLEVLQRGLAQPEHAAFVATLQQAGSRKS